MKLRIKVNGQNHFETTGVWITVLLSFFRKDACLVDHWEILPDEITCIEKIGHGQFGQVHIAEMKSRDATQKGKLRSKGQWKDKLHRPKIIVALKMLCGEW